MKCVISYQIHQNNTIPPRSSHCAAVWNEKMIIFGGIGKKLCNTLYEYDLRTNTWKVLNETLVKTTGHCAGIYNDSLIIFGGYGKNVPYFTNALIECNLITLKWKYIDVPKQNLPCPRCLATLVVYDSSIIIFGGRAHSYENLNDLYKFSFKKRKWEAIYPKGKSPPKREAHSATLINQRMYIFGGRCGGFRFNDLWEFDIQTKRWRQILYSKGCIPTPRSGSSLVSVNNELLLFGGFDGKEDSNALYCMKVLLQPKWQKIEFYNCKPLERSFHSAVILNGKMIIFGGYNGIVGTYLNDLFAIHLSLVPEGMQLMNGILCQHFIDVEFIT